MILKYLKFCKSMPFKLDLILLSFLIQNNKLCNLSL